MKRILLFSICIFMTITFVNSQTVFDEIPQSSYDNFAECYNYTFWDDNFKTTIADDRKFSIQTSSFGINVNFDDLTIQSLNINSNNAGADVAFAASKASLFPTDYTGNIDFAVLQNGVVIHQKDVNNPTSFGIKDSQIGEYGTWINRRFVSTNFTNNPPFEFYYTGIDFANWHDRLKITLHVRPTIDIINGQLQLSVEIPSIYGNQFNDGTFYAFANANDAGFVAKGGSTINNFNVLGNTIILTTALTNMVANNSYEVALILYPKKENVSATYKEPFEAETPINLTADQTLPNPNSDPTISYNADEGMYYLDIARHGMGYNNCGQVDVLQNIELSLENTSNTDKKTRLCFQQMPNVNVVGFNSLIRNNNGDPSGFPLQVSKNWHTGTPQQYSGSWIREYTEIIVPANTTINVDYTRTGAKWGETYSASSHQLSVAGSGVPKGGWLEAALGSFGETVTHSPDYFFGNSNVCDYRPFLVTNQNYQGTSVECLWTGNVGGMDMWIYTDDTDTRIYQSEVKTRFQRYSPNLTETSISAITSDKKLKLDYTFYLNRSDDYVRVFYKVKIKALQNTPFTRFDIFQMGGDNYNVHTPQMVYYGDDSGTLGQFLPTNDGSNDYTNSAIAMTGNRPWIYTGDGLHTLGYGELNIDTNNGMILHDYKAAFEGVAADTPYFRERSSSTGFSANSGMNPTSYCLVPPPGTTNFMAGDSVEVVLETVILPKMATDYYGPNVNFANALAMYGNSVDLFLREVQGNAINLTSTQNTINNTYPYSVETNNNTALLSMTGGKGYVPLIFKGVSDITDPQLWKSENDCWELVDQSVNGKDFWQADYDPNTGLFDVTYNVNQDQVGDAIANNHYYFGDNPPIPTIIIQSNYNYQGWTLSNTINAYIDEHAHFAPQVQENGVTSVGDGQWSWIGPNGFTANTRNIPMDVLSDTNFGVYTVTYTAPYGCSVSQDFELICAEQDANGNCVTAECGGFIPTAYTLNGNHTSDNEFKTNTFIESTATVDPTTNISYIAQQSIELNPDFEVVLGSTFCAFISNCLTTNALKEKEEK